jgi:hypothetical protein
VQELEAAGMTQFRENYAEAIGILEVIDKGNHDSGPLELAADLGIISAAEIPQVMSLKSSAGDPKFDIDKTKNNSELINCYFNLKNIQID